MPRIAFYGNDAKNGAWTKKIKAYIFAYYGDKLEVSRKRFLLISIFYGKNTQNQVSALRFF